MIREDQRRMAIIPRQEKAWKMKNMYVRSVYVWLVSIQSYTYNQSYHHTYHIYSYPSHQIPFLSFQAEAEFAFEGNVRMLQNGEVGLYATSKAMDSQSG